MNHDDSRRLWTALEAEYAVLHPTQPTPLDSGAGIWIGKVHDLVRDGRSFESAWAEVQREIQVIEGRYIAPASPNCRPKRARTALSYYTSLTDPRIDVAAFAARLCDAGVTSTRVWLLDAWAVSARGGTGCYDGYVPWLRDADGVFDLWHVDVAYLTRLRQYVETMNAHQIVPVLSGLELYTWSNRKQGMLWVPDAAAGFFRRNRQGLVYGDDAAFTQIATRTGDHGFLEAFYGECVKTLAGTQYDVELGNEMPEKELHYRLRDAWRRQGFAGRIQVNRHEDTPGQYANMRVGTDFDALALHGKRALDYLDEDFPREPAHRTFRAFLRSEAYAPGRVTFSSDGCRKSTNPDDAYDYDALGAVFTNALALGCAIEHQSALKLRGFTGGSITLNDLETDWLLSLSKG